MSYCYCTPSRSLSNRRYAPGEQMGSYFETVMGTKGEWVQRGRREGAIRGWQTRRRNLALKHRAVTEALATDDRVPFVIDAPSTPLETTVFAPDLVEAGD